MRQAATDLLGNGVTLAAGAAHVWDIPPGGATLNVSGTASVRITFISRSGGLLEDREFVPGDGGTIIQVPAKTERFVAQCLGNAPAGVPQGFGAISASAAPPGNFAATGWQAASMLIQAGASLFLARGASVRLPRPFTASRSGIKTSQTMIRGSELMRDETAVETTLPVETGVVMILLDQQDSTAAAQGDFAIGCDGATLATPPLHIEGGARRALLYQVSQVAPDASSITISTGSAAGWRVSGVGGLPGQAQEWAVRANGGVPEHLVPAGPLTPDGAVTIRFTIATGGAA
jgi:hypothetical protein